ncbi:MAG: threonine synthase, partial [Alphaproteobacteria bacterium]
MARFVSRLLCSRTGEALDADRVWNLSPAGAPILVEYDLDAVRRSVSRDEIAARGGGFWRWRELLPLFAEEDVIDLGEVETPLIPLARLAGAVGGNSTSLLVKDEGRLPTGSFKARGLALAVAMARRFGSRALAMPTNGNAGAALAAYAARAGMAAHVFCPADTPAINIREIASLGARVYRVDGLIDECGRLLARHAEQQGWFDVSTLKEPYRIEGKKTMGYEVAEQMQWRLPDAIFYPTGGGVGLIGMWKAFDEMEALGWIGPQRPKMIVVQAAGCAPVVKAFGEGKERAEFWQNARTISSGLRVPKPLGDFLILRIVRASGGTCIAVEDREALEAGARLGRLEGIFPCPEGAACFAALERLLENGFLRRADRIVIFNT